jgi:hypothetical protein
VAFRILESGMRNSKAVIPRVVPVARLHRDRTRDRPTLGRPKDPRFWTAFKKAWRPPTPSRRMDEVVSKIVPDTQPIIPSTSVSYSNQESIAIAWFRPTLSAAVPPWPQFISNQTVRRRSDLFAEHGVRHR